MGGWGGTVFDIISVCWLALGSMRFQRHFFCYLGVLRCFYFQVPLATIILLSVRCQMHISACGLLCTGFLILYRDCLGKATLPGGGGVDVLHMGSTTLCIKTPKAPPRIPMSPARLSRAAAAHSLMSAGLCNQAMQRPTRHEDIN